MNFNFFKHYWAYFIISLIFLGTGVFFLGTRGLRPAIDFTGGTLIEVTSSATLPSTTEEMQKALGEKAEVSSVQKVSDQNYIFRTKEIDNAQKTEVVTALKQQFGADITEQRFETVGPTLGKELLLKTIIAVSIVALVITFYVMKQFSELKYGISAVLAMFHDTLMLFGAFAILGALYGVEVDVLFVTAVLTTLSFSVHDTIVVFDRIRELRHKFPKETLQSISDLAVKQTLTRSFNNSMTIIFMLLSLVLLGGDSVRWFVVALLIGAVTGTYSSTFTAIPLLLLWEDMKRKTGKQEISKTGRK